MLNLKEKKDRAVKFVSHDIWRFEPAGWAYNFAVKALRFIVMTAHGFTQDNCLLRATALAYTTIFSIIPAMAVIFALMGNIAPEYEDQILEFILDQVVPGPVEEDVSEAPDNDAPAQPAAPEDETAPDNPQSPADEQALEHAANQRQPAPPDPQERESQATARSDAVENEATEPSVQDEARQFRDIRTSLRDWIKRGTTMLNRVSSTVGTIGVIILIFAVISLLAEIERTFNTIWGVKRGRRYLSKVIYYWAAISFVPLFVIISIAGAAALLGSEEFAALRSLPVIQTIAESPTTTFLLTILAPFVFMWITFAALYFFMPNTTVKIQSALFGGFTAAILFELLKWAQFTLNEKFIRYSILFGSLAAVPILLVWIYFIWLIALFGCEIAFASQNIKTYQRERRVKDISQAARESIALRMMALAAWRFVNAKPPLTEQEVSEWFDIPVRLVRDLSNQMHEAGLLATAGDGETRYQPGRSLEKITPKDVINCLRRGDEMEMRGEIRPEDRRIAEIYKQGEIAADTVYTLTSFAEIVKTVDSKETTNSSQSTVDS